MTPGGSQKSTASGKSSNWVVRPLRQVLCKLSDERLFKLFRAEVGQCGADVIAATLGIEPPSHITKREIGKGRVGHAGVLVRLLKDDGPGAGKSHGCLVVQRTSVACGRSAEVGLVLFTTDVLARLPEATQCGTHQVKCLRHPWGTSIAIARRHSA